MLSTIYRDQGNYKLAYDYYNIYVNQRNNLDNEQSGQNLVRQQLSYDYAKKTASDSVKHADEQKVADAQIAAGNEKIARQKQQEYFLYGGLALVLVFAGVVYNRFRLTRRQRDTIESQKIIVEQKQAEVLSSIRYATRIQQALLAGEQLLENNLPGYFIFYQPKDIVSGDFYWASDTGEKFWLCAADCTGHGVPGAFMSLLSISFLNEAVNEKKIDSPSRVLDHVRDRLVDALAADGSAEGGKDGMDGILCCFDFKAKKLSFANANNALWIIRRENNAFVLEETTPDKMPVGKYERDQQPFTHYETGLEKDNLLYLFTDGFSDQFGGPHGRKLMRKRVKELLLQHAHLPLEKQEEELRKAFREWKGNLEQVDDVLVIGIKT